MDITTLSAAYKMVRANCAGLENAIDSLENETDNIVNALNSFLPNRVCTIAKSDSKTIVYPDAGQHLLVVTGGGSNLYGLFIVYCSGSALTIADVSKGSNVTYSKSGTELTISNGNSSNGMFVCDITFYGNPPTEKVVTGD